MYRLAILEDDSTQLDLLDKIIQTTKYGSEIETARFSNAVELEQSLLDGASFDIALVDIRLADTASNENIEPAETGIDVVHKLFVATNTQVIYVTGYDMYHSDVYKTPHVFFLLKPVTAERMTQALEAALLQLKNIAEKPLRLRVGQDEVVIEPHTIRYVESHRRQLHIHTVNGELVTYLRLDTLENMLPSSFVRCHKSYLANLDYVTRYRVNELELNDGSIIPVSQSRRATVRDWFFDHVRGTR